MFKSDKIMKNGMHHEGLCSLKGFKFGLVAEAPQYTSTLPYITTGSTLKALPPNPHSSFRKQKK